MKWKSILSFIILNYLIFFLIGFNSQIYFEIKYIWGASILMNLCGVIMLISKLKIIYAIFEEYMLLEQEICIRLSRRKYRIKLLGVVLFSVIFTFFINMMIDYLFDVKSFMYYNLLENIIMVIYIYCFGKYIYSFMVISIFMITLKMVF